MAKKATRVRYSGIAPFIDDTQANRIQALGSSSRLTTEDMKELGTQNIVEIVDDVPQVDISIDQNENGTNELAGLFANKGYGCNVVALPSGGAIGSASVKVLPGSYFVNGERIFFEGIPSLAVTAGAQKIYLKGEVAGGAVAKVAVAATTPAGGIEIASVSGSALISQANIIDTRSFKQITAVDYELANVDIFVPVKQSGDGDVIKRTMYMERAFANNIDFSFQTSGVATSSFRLETDNKRWFLNDNAQIVVKQFKTAVTPALTLDIAPAVLANGNRILKATKNGVNLTEGSGKDFTVSGVTLTLSVAPVAGDIVKVRYTAANTGQFFIPVPVAENPHPELAGGLKQGQIEIYLSDNISERVSRVQSARMSLPLTREQLAELGSLKPYDRPMQLPVNVTVSLELRDSDLEMMARFAGYNNLATVDEIALEDLVKNLGLTIKLYRESDVKRAKLPAGHPDKYAIKTYTITNLIPQSENWDVRVDSDATQSFEFLAHNIAISDSIVPN